MTAHLPDRTTEPEFGSLAAFVADHLAHVYARQVIDTHAVAWCPQWWRHPEAVARLAALHAVYESARHSGPVAMSDWWLLHADPHMSRLFDPAGPFRYCSARHGHKDLIDPLPVVPPPADAPTDPGRPQQDRRKGAA